jgi:tRNA G10  N-methylase Trm11
MIGTGRSVTRRIGTKGCECGAPTTPGVVLDPFAGSFTTCLVAAKMGLGFIGIELSEKYVEIGRRRLAPYMRPLSSFDGEAEA